MTSFLKSNTLLSEQTTYEERGFKITLRPAAVMIDGQRYDIVAATAKALPEALCVFGQIDIREADKIHVEGPMNEMGYTPGGWSVEDAKANVSASIEAWYNSSIYEAAKAAEKQHDEA